MVPTQYHTQFCDIIFIINIMILQVKISVGLYLFFTMLK